MKKHNAPVAFAIGASGYCFVETLWRGYSHISMAVVGGVCFAFFHNVICRGVHNILGRCALGAVFITAVELVSGCVCNLRLNLGVWDYSKKRMNVRGQICLGYSVLWFLLCVPMSFLSDTLKRFYK